MRVWQVQEAKNKFSELLRDAEGGEVQTITRHGAEVAVVLSAQQYKQLKGDADSPSLKAVLLGGPKVDDFEVPRSMLRLRDVDF